MDRREFLTLGVTTVAVSAMAKPASAQTPGTGWKNHLDAYSRTLHWLRTPAEVAKACHEIGNTTIDLTVRNYPAHVQPDKVKTDLPMWVNGLKREGITVTKIGMDINDANTPYVEDMLATASGLGIHHTWWRGVGTLDLSQGYQKGLDAQKVKTEPLAKLLAKYNFKACYHPGGGFTEMLDLCRAFDPKNISIDYDTGNFGQFNQGTLANQIRIAGPYVGSFVFKDFFIDHTLPQQQAGAAAAAAAAPATGRGAAQAAPADAGGAAAGAAPAAGRGGRGGAGRGAPGGGAPAAADGGDAGAAPAGGRGGRGGGGGSPNGWSSRQVPVGSGVLNLALICQALKDINFQGPIECQPEWPELGGPNSGAERLSIPREEVIRMLRRDYLTVSTPLAAAGVI